MKLVLISLLLAVSFSHALVEAEAEKTDYLKLSGKAVLVTGASSGIGRRIAETLADQGAFVYAGARKERDINELSKHKNMLGIRLDVTKPDEISAAVKFVEQQGRGLYGLVNNAGVFFHAPLIEVSQDDMDFMMNVNLFGPYRVTKAFAPLLIESQGRVSNISSVAGITAGPMFGPYAMSKFSIEAFSESLSHEMRKFNVQVSAIEPGNFKSNIMKNMQKRAELMERENQPTLYQKEYKAMTTFTLADRSHHRDPVAVANAVKHALFSKNPKLRYLVAPTQAEADFAINAAINKLIQLNSDHEFSLDNRTLRQRIDTALANTNISNGVTSSAHQAKSITNE